MGLAAPTRPPPHRDARPSSRRFRRCPCEVVWGVFQVSSDRDPRGGSARAPGVSARCRGSPTSIVALARSSRQEVGPGGGGPGRLRGRLHPGPQYARLCRGSGRSRSTSPGPRCGLSGCGRARPASGINLRAGHHDPLAPSTRAASRAVPRGPCRHSLRSSDPATRPSRTGPWHLVVRRTVLLGRVSFEHGVRLCLGCCRGRVRFKLGCPLQVGMTFAPRPGSARPMPSLAREHSRRPFTPCPGPARPLRRRCSRRCRGRACPARATSHPQGA
jgi:hypothetical protein